MIENFLNNLASDNTEKTDSSFNNLIMTKVNTVLDISRIELTSDIFNKQKSVSESADDAYKCALAQEQSNPRFVESQDIIAQGLTPTQAQAFDSMISQWVITGGNLQQLLRNFYQKLLLSGNNISNPRMQKALAFVLDKL